MKSRKLDEIVCIKAANKVAAKFARNQPPKTVTWELKVRQMGLQKKELAEIMVDQLDLTCTPEQYLEETYKYHMELFGDVSIKSSCVFVKLIFSLYSLRPIRPNF